MGGAQQATLGGRHQVVEFAVQMRHVDFHVDSSVVLHIAYLRGELQPTSPEHAPYFDDKNSFVLAIDTARVTMTPSGLSPLGIVKHLGTVEEGPLARKLLEERGVLPRRKKHKNGAEWLFWAEEANSSATR